MKKKKNINFLGKALLLLYIFSMAPSLIFYLHHDEGIVAFSEADTCEKAIYYGIQDDHKQHLSKSQEECLLCDHHTVTPQILFASGMILSPLEFCTEYFSWYKSYDSIELIGISNKDPPFFA